MTDNTESPAAIDLAALPADALLTDSEVASAIRTGRNTLANWRTATRYGKPTGPKFIKLAGSMVRYRVGDVREFIAKGVA